MSEPRTEAGPWWWARERHTRFDAAYVEGSHDGVHPCEHGMSAHTERGCVDCACTTHGFDCGCRLHLDLYVAKAEAARVSEDRHVLWCGDPQPHKAHGMVPIERHCPGSKPAEPVLRPKLERPFEQCDEPTHNSVLYERQRGYRVRRSDCIDCARAARPADRAEPVLDVAVRRYDAALREAGRALLDVASDIGAAPFDPASINAKTIAGHAEAAAKKIAAVLVDLSPALSEAQTDGW